MVSIAAATEVAQAGRRSDARRNRGSSSNIICGQGCAVRGGAVTAIAPTLQAFFTE